MNHRKAFPIAVVLLVIVVLAIVLVLLRQEGLLNLGSPDAGDKGAAGAVVELRVVKGEVNPVNVPDFDQYIQSADQPVFVDFWAAWCGPCREAAPFIEQLALEYDGRAHILKVDVDQSLALARQYNARSIPLFVVFNQGVPVDQAMGYTATSQIQDSLRDLIDRQLS